MPQLSLHVFLGFGWVVFFLSGGEQSRQDEHTDVWRTLGACWVCECVQVWGLLVLQGCGQVRGACTARLFIGRELCRTLYTLVAQCCLAALGMCLCFGCLLHSLQLFVISGILWFASVGRKQQRCQPLATWADDFRGVCCMLPPAEQHMCACLRVPHIACVLGTSLASRCCW